MDAWMDEWQILTPLIWDAVYVSTRMWQLSIPPRWVLFVAEGMQLVSQGLELSMDMQTA